MKRDKPKPMPPRPDGEPMTSNDIRTLRKAIDGFDDIEMVAPSIREVVETHMPDLLERLPPEHSLVAQVQRRIEAKAKREEVTAQSRARRKTPRKRR